MYISKNKHVLSNAILVVAILNIVSEIVCAITRRIVESAYSLSPTLLDDTVWRVQSIVSCIQVFLTTVIFFLAYRRMSYYRKLIPQEDQEEMQRLQEEFISDKVSTLPARIIAQLLQIWAAILIGVEIIYNVTSSVYRDFISALTQMITISDQNTYTAFVAMYNNTHGFKYIGMLIAICIGILTSGVFLRDRFLMIASGVLTLLFLIVFVALRANTLILMDRAVGVVWTSVIFHLLQTAGLLTLSLYLRYKFRGI